jgi:hypothetical protein
MDKKEIEDILRKACDNLFANQPNLDDFTSETGQTEWNLSHHLANEINKLLKFYDHDLDITKRNYDNKRPDIIFHKRGNNKDNLLVVEIKRNGSPREIKNDIDKIKKDWFRDRLSYAYGAIINIKNNHNIEIEVFKNKTTKKSF